MKFLRGILDKQKPMFQKGGKLEKFHYLFEAGETFLYVPNEVTPKKGAQIRDAIDLKRLMMTVVIAMIPCLLFGIWNVGHQYYFATGADGSFIDKILVGSKQVLPVVLVSYVAGGLVEVVFSTIRRHPINEGFLVTGMLIPLIMPPNIPLWQVAMATIFSIVIAKEVFGGTGMNILNVALTARVFLYFGFPSDISGDVWTYYDEDKEIVSGYSGATPLAIGASTVGSTNSDEVVNLLDEYSTEVGNSNFYSFDNMLIGSIPGSIGETSFIMCMIGAFILVFTGLRLFYTTPAAHRLRHTEPAGHGSCPCGAGARGNKTRLGQDLTTREDRRNARHDTHHIGACRHRCYIAGFYDLA